jgi:hypothetical protein
MMVLALLAGPALAGPPARPLPMTATQYEAVCQVENQADHTAVLVVRASYTSEHEAMMAANLVTNDITTAATDTVWLGTPILLLILAAPL